MLFGEQVIPAAKPLFHGEPIYLGWIKE